MGKEGQAMLGRMYRYFGWRHHGDRPRITVLARKGFGGGDRGTFYTYMFDM